MKNLSKALILSGRGIDGKPHFYTILQSMLPKHATPAHNAKTKEK